MPCSKADYVARYLHQSDRSLPPTLGVLVQLDAPAEETGKDVAQQVAAMRPQYVTRDQVPADVVEHERRIAEQITREEGKPEQAIGKIVEGRLGAFFKDVVLTEQAFVKDPKKTIRQVLSEQGVTVTAFVRFQVGQAGEGVPRRGPLSGPRAPRADTRLACWCLRRGGEG